MRVLLIEDNEDDALIIREMLVKAKGAPFDLEWADRLSTGLERLAEGGIDVVLLDLGLPDSRGLETLSKAHGQAPEAPIVVLTGLADETVGVKAVQNGAQDYLAKGQVDGNLLARTLHYAIERKQAEEALREAEVMRRLSVSRTLVGQMLRDLQELGGLSEGAMFRAGQELAARVAAESLPKFLEAFADMGLGALNLACPEPGRRIEADEERRRWTFTGDGLVETRTESGQPSCNYARGFLCSAVAHVLGGTRVAGVEMACQSMGDEVCKFVVQVVGE
ncbi:MAG: response regulator [Anaerolineae bacterium]